MAERNYMALSQGFETAMSQGRARQDRVDKQAKLKRDEQLKLTKAGYSRDEDGGLTPLPNSDAEVSQKQNEMLMKQMRGMQTKMTLGAVTQATGDYLKTGNANHLQSILDNDENAREMFAKRNIQQFGNVDFRNDQDLFKQYGIKIENLTEAQEKDLGKKFFKVYDGKKWTVLPTDHFIAQTGYLRHSNASQMEIFDEFQNIGKKGKQEDPELTKAKIATEKAKGGKYISDGAANTSKAKSQAIRAGSDATYKESIAGVATRRLEETITNNDVKAEATQARDAQAKANNEAKLQQKKDEVSLGKTAKERGQNRAKLAGDTYLGSKGLDYASFADYIPKTPKDKADLAQASEAIKQGLNYKPTSFIIKQASEMAEIINLGAGASKISADDLGYIDDSQHSMASFMTEDKAFYKNIGAKSSYEAYKGLFRVSMIGSAQTESELKYFRKFLGDQTQKAIIIKTQLLGSLKGLRAKMQPLLKAVPSQIVARDMFGTTTQALNESIARLEKSLGTKPSKEDTEKSRAAIRKALASATPEAKKLQESKFAKRDAERAREVKKAKGSFVPPKARQGETREKWLVRAKQAKKEFDK